MSIRLAIDNTICEHRPSRINMDGICLDCNQKVMKMDCDCGICMFCCGMRKMVDYFGFDPRDENCKCPRCGKSKLAAKFEICCM